MTIESLSDTIVAIATPPGAAECGVLRLSGDGVFPILEPLFRDASGKSLAAAGWRSVSGLLRVELAGAGPVDAPCTAWVMPAPRSYTRENVVELLLPGSPPLLRAALRAVCSRGARLAGPGEFTLRAFLNGRLDLGQAEAVERLVLAENETDRREALERLTTALCRQVGSWREELLHLAATVEAVLDFDEEDLDPGMGENIAAAVRRVAGECEALAARAAPHRPAREGIPVLLTGLTNAGKSSLFNALCGADAALVSDTPSTTRDRLRQEVVWQDLRFILEDSPGFDPGGGGFGPLVSESAARHAESAHLACLDVDASRPDVERVREFLGRIAQTPAVAVLHKADCPPALDEDELRRLIRECGGAEPHFVVRTSVVDGTGLEALQQSIVAVAVGDLASSRHGRLSAREGAELAAAARHCRAAETLLDNEEGIELLAEEMRAAHAALARAGGHAYAEDILEDIFSRFCIGK